MNLEKFSRPYNSLLNSSAHQLKQMMEDNVSKECAPLLQVCVDDNDSVSSVAIIDPHSRPSQNYHTPSRQCPNYQTIPRQIKGFHVNGLLSPNLKSDPLEFDLDHAAIRLSWHNITVNVLPKTGRCCSLFARKSRSGGADDTPKRILTNVSGIAEPGTLLAILGASGAGKSTLLNVLNRRNTSSLTITGDVRVNGADIGSAISVVSGYVQQDDMFIGLLTVEEHLTFHAMLRMSSTLTNVERRERVKNVMTELGLTNCANTRIGTPGKTVGISGGERKRLAFASEVLTNPGILFCDEPTSGLDSFKAESVVRSLKNLTAQGKTVVCTIHQPSSQVNALFDRVLYMAEGRVAYHGPANEIAEFFNKAGYVCPPDFNPSDHYIQTLAICPGREEESKKITHTICNAYEQSPQHSDVMSRIQGLSERNNVDMAIMVRAMTKRSRYKASVLRQFIWVLWRSWITVVRTPSLTTARLTQGVVTSVLFGLIYLNQVTDQKGVMNINGVLFLLIQQASFGSVFPVTATFPLEFPIFMREHLDSTYRTSVYFISKSLSELPTFIIIPIFAVCITYFMIGFYPSAEAFIMLGATLILVTNVSVSYGYMLSCSTNNLNVILALGPMTLVPLMIFGGLFLNNGSVPVYFLWLRYISWFSYSNEIVIVNQWQYVSNITCEVKNQAEGIFSSLVATVMPGLSTTSRCYQDGPEVIESLGYDSNNLHFDFLMLVVLMVVFRVIGFIFLYLRSRRRH